MCVFVAGPKSLSSDLLFFGGRLGIEQFKKQRKKEQEQRKAQHCLPSRQREIAPRCTCHGSHGAPRQTQLLRSDFEKAELTSGCSGCDVIRLNSIEAARHNDACRQRVEPVMQQFEAGRLRIRRAHERVAQYMDDLLQAPAERRGGTTTATRASGDPV